MNEAEKERLIKKDIVSIENRVRHAFNQGYEMGLKESRSEIPNTCGDAISRQAVLDAMYELCDTGETLKENPWRDNPHIDVLVDAIEELPPVNPQEPKTAHWEWVKYDYHPRLGDWICSECKSVAVVCVRKEEKGGIPFYKYCPQCGAKMIEPQESEE